MDQDPGIPDSALLSSGESSPEGTHTPRESDAIHFTPRRAMTSFENLVALANHQERLREAKRMVWRDRGQPVVELDSIKACFNHAALGGFRSGSLAFSIRALVNLVLVLIRIRRTPKDIRIRVLRQAIFGLHTWRFAAMLGTFTSLYKFLLNALPIVIPAMNPRTLVDVDNVEQGLSTEHPTNTLEVPLSKRTARLSLSQHAQEIIIRKKTRKWHAALAGAISGGLAIMWEARSRRGVISQQIGLQGSYNSYTKKRGIHIPYGDVLVFALASGQIMYGFLLRPDTLPRSYSTWIGQAGKIPPECVRMNMSMVRDQSFEIADLDRVVSFPETTAENRVNLLSLKSLFLNRSLEANPIPDPAYFPPYAPCSAIHPALTNCTTVPLDRFVAVFKWMLPIYGALHLVPAILFKRAAFLKDPKKVLMRAGWGSMRSSAFLGTFVVIYQSLNCLKHNLHAYLSLTPLGNHIPQFMKDVFVSKFSFWMSGLLAGLSLFVEEKRRRGELAMYVLPKGLESLWIMARGKGLVFKTGNWGDMLLTALGMAMVMSTYQNDPQHLSGLVRRLLYQFIGPN
ncbi:hypothetical protein BDN72DRAFT_485408 [Pluteus cervinus]|uniref:Uncharacterized protein n=1 Tax=Pluteus cervinus TaxID=181527 RepID=A0ACD3A5W6_9AGAR|nr:hypothetical protein BDN72DRAFT_485408 [Pluteus cervinus]